jgi:RNA polymerase sigma-70 factor (ECF subfamily)
LTRWSLVLEAQRGGDTGAHDALAELCRLYWFPVYAYIRHRGNSAHDAEDLTQGFFANLLERRSLDAVSEGKGRLRTFILTVVSRYLANEYHKAQTEKRGGGRAHVPIDADWAEERYSVEPVDRITPELLFQRQWAVTLLDNVFAALRDDYTRNGKAAVFEELKAAISCNAEPSAYAVSATKLGLTEAAVKVAVHRLRQRYRRLLHDQIARTVDSPDDINDELMNLFSVFETPHT